MKRLGCTALATWVLMTTGCMTVGVRVEYESAEVEGAKAVIEAKYTPPLPDARNPPKPAHLPPPPPPEEALKRTESSEATPTRTDMTSTSVPRSGVPVARIASVAPAASHSL